MEKINFPQVVSQSDQINTLDPGRNQLDYFAALDALEEEYQQKL